MSADEEPTGVNLLAEADRCVKCGLCLPECPTYQLAQDENESPRGRIGLIQGWALQALPPSERLFGHLDRCLLCRRCERVCPAHVRYGQLLDNFRAATQLQRRESGRSAWLRRVLRERRWARGVAGLAAWAEHWGLRNLARHTGVLKSMGLDDWDALLPVLGGTVKLDSYYPAAGEPRGTVGLFVGCLAPSVDNATLTAAITVLTSCGYAVSVPAAQSCCGALDAHAGDLAQASHCAQHNTAAFAAVDTVVTVASGCAAMLRDAFQAFPRASGVAELAAKTIDFSAFLVQTNAVTRLPLQSLPIKVVLHQPCTLRNVLRTDAAVNALLQQLPGVEVIVMPEHFGCCGSAGTYMLDQPAWAQQLRKPLLDFVAEMRPEGLVTSNIGCALHLRAGLRALGQEVAVMHPAQLVAQCGMPLAIG